MKNKQIHFFLLEFTLSLIILSVTLLVALSMFTQAAKQHEETQALRKLSGEMAMTAETLRNPMNEWPYQNERKTVSTFYDVKGEVTTGVVVYILTIDYDARDTLRKATLTLRDMSKKALLTIQVNALTEVPE